MPDHIPQSPRNVVITQAAHEPEAMELTGLKRKPKRILSPFFFKS